MSPEPIKFNLINPEDESVKENNYNSEEERLKLKKEFESLEKKDRLRFLKVAAFVIITGVAGYGVHGVVDNFDKIKDGVADNLGKLRYSVTYNIDKLKNFLKDLKGQDKQEQEDDDFDVNDFIKKSDESDSKIPDKEIQAVPDKLVDTEEYSLESELREPKGAEEFDFDKNKFGELLESYSTNQDSAELIQGVMNTYYGFKREISRLLDAAGIEEGSHYAGLIVRLNNDDIGSLVKLTKLLIESIESDALSDDISESNRAEMINYLDDIHRQAEMILSNRVAEVNNDDLEISEQERGEQILKNIEWLDKEIDPNGMELTSIVDCLKRLQSLYDQSDHLTDDEVSYYNGLVFAFEEAVKNSEMRDGLKSRVLQTLNQLIIIPKK